MDVMLPICVALGHFRVGRFQFSSRGVGGCDFSFNLESNRGSNVVYCLLIDIPALWYENVGAKCNLLSRYASYVRVVFTSHNSSKR